MRPVLIGIRRVLATAVVLARPGTPSRRRCPSASRPTRSLLQEIVLADDHPSNFGQQPIEGFIMFADEFTNLLNICVCNRHAYLTADPIPTVSDTTYRLGQLLFD
jgi:hypothetical protein